MKHAIHKTTLLYLGVLLVAATALAFALYQNHVGLPDHVYDQQPPWKRLAENPQLAVISSKEIDEVLSQHLAAIEQKGRTRDTVLASLNRLQVDQ